MNILQIKQITCVLVWIKLTHLFLSFLITSYNLAKSDSLNKSIRMRWTQQPPSRHFTGLETALLPCSWIAVSQGICRIKYKICPPKIPPLRATFLTKLPPSRLAPRDLFPRKYVPCYQFFKDFETFPRCLHTEEFRHSVPPRCPLNDSVSDIYKLLHAHDFLKLCFLHEFINKFHKEKYNALEFGCMGGLLESLKSTCRNLQHAKFWGVGISVVHRGLRIINGAPRSHPPHPKAPQPPWFLRYRVTIKLCHMLWKIKHVLLKIAPLTWSGE